MAVQSHVIDMFEHAELQSDPSARQLMLTFVVAGAGFAGVETVAGLQDCPRR
jgi:NADH dehydrogenase